VGRQQRVRTQLVAGANGGKACPAGAQTYEQSKICYERSCDDCAVSAWMPLYGCSKSCGSGVQIYRRTITKSAVLTGASCPGLLRQEPCNTAACPVDCVVATWGAFGSCNKPCGGGWQSRVRTLTEPTFGGKTCPSNIDHRVCNPVSCPEPCKVAPWGKWSTNCSRSCGSGVIFRKREIQAPPQLGGMPCPNLVDYLHCNTKPCPEDCEVGEWGEFAACTKSCGGGHTVRTRKLLRAPMKHGDACPSLLEARDCNAHACRDVKCHDSHAHCYVRQSDNKVVVTHSKEAWDLGGRFKCQVKPGSRNQLSRMFSACECHCDTHQGCCYRENVALHNPPLPGNVLDERHVTSVDGCCHRCTMHPDCGSWEFTTRGTHGNPILPRLELVEGKELTFEENMNQQYLDAGATCFDGEMDISRKITTTGDVVDIGNAGTYTLVYHCTGFGGAVALPATRIVTVTPRDGPQLVLLGAVSQVFFKGAHDIYLDPGAKCISAKGDPLAVVMPANSDVRKDVIGNTALKYACTDPDTGKEVSAERTVTILPEGFGIPDELRPLLSLLGAETESFDESQTATYADAGAKCFAHSSNRSLKPVMSGDNVNLAKAGIYNVQWDCSDEEGVPAKTAMRAVHVLPKLRPVLTSSSGYLESFSRSDTQTYVQPAVQCFDRDGADISSLVKRSGDTVRLNIVGEYVQRFDCQDTKGTAALTLVHRVVVMPVNTVRRVGKALCVLKSGEPVFVKLRAPEFKGDSIAYAGPRAPSTIAEAKRQGQEFCPAGDGKVTNASSSSHPPASSSSSTELLV
jgi:hypothetical protein